MDRCSSETAPGGPTRANDAGSGLISRYRAWRRRREEAWEAICTGCGLCCYEREAVPLGKVRIRRFSACRFLDLETRRCTVYEYRFQACSYCAKVRLFHALFDPTMPPDCGYVRRYRPRWLRGRLAEPVPELSPKPKTGSPQGGGSQQQAGLQRETHGRSRAVRSRA